MRLSVFLVTSAALAGSMSADAQTLELSLRGSGGYDSNVYSTEDETESGVFKMSAQGAASDEFERASYRLSYEPTQIVYARPSATNAWNHLAFAEGTYDLSERTELTVRDSFGYTERIPQDNENTNVNDQGDRTLLRNTVDMQVQHRLTQRLSANLSSEYSLYEYNQVSEDDSNYMSATGSMNYMLTPTTTVGGGGGGGLRAFDPSAPSACGALLQGRPGSRSVNVQGFASIEHQFNETTRISLRAGPAQIESNDYACEADENSTEVQPLPPFFMKDTTQEITWFAAASGQKRWKAVSTSASYRRSEGVGGSSTGSAINDNVSGQVRWQISRLWDAEVSGAWLQRDSTAVSGDEQAQDVTTWRAMAQVSRQLSQRSTVTLSALYIDQTTTGDSDSGARSSSTGYQAYRFNLGFTYRFEPWRF